MNWTTKLCIFVCLVNFNGTFFSYGHNSQGDIVGIVDNRRKLVVEYAYDAWGKCGIMHVLNVGNSMLSNLNPFRYRAYIYDEETELDCLKSRYYDAQVDGRAYM